MAAAAALAVATIAILRPFLAPLAWAAILAYLCWPVFKPLKRRARRPRLAAALFAAGIGVGLGIPLALLLVALADDATDLVRNISAWWQAGPELPAWFADSFVGRQAIDLLDRLQFTREEEWVRRAGGEVTRRLVAVAGGLARNAFSFGVTLVTLYVFLTSGEAILDTGRRLAPLLFPTAPERFLERIGEAVRAVVFGLLGTAFVQGALAGIGLAVAGVPSAVALGAGTVVLSFFPGGGGALTLLSAVWLGVGGEVGVAIALALWGLLVVSSVDNVLRPLLISERGGIHFLVVFFGVIGGLATFGLIGLFIGPVLLSISRALVTEFARSAQGGASPGPAGRLAAPAERS